MKQEMSKCDEMNEQMCLFFFTRSHRSLMCCLTMMFPASNLMCPDLEISTRGQSRSDRFYLTSLTNHLYFEARCGSFCRPPIAHWSCKIGVQDFYGRSSYFREVWKGPAQSSLYWTPPIWSCHWPQGFSRHLFFASAEASRPARLLLFTVILAMIRDLTVFTYLKEE